MKPFVCVRIKRNLSYRGQLFIGRREGFVTRWTTSRRRQNVETKRPRWCPPTTTVTTWNLLRRRRPRITKNLFRLDRDRYENKFFFFLRASTAEALLPNARGRGQTRLSFFRRGCRCSERHFQRRLHGRCVTCHDSIFPLFLLLCLFLFASLCLCFYLIVWVFLLSLFMVW